MSDNDDLLGDDLGDHSLADYNLGNEEEEQLLADDFENGASQNVPTSVVSGYVEGGIDSTSYTAHDLDYNNPQPSSFQSTEPECVVPNITVEIPNTPLPEQSTYAPYNEAYENEHAVPTAIPAAPAESPQIVPSEVIAPTSDTDADGPRERFMSERPPGAQRTPQVRDIPDTLDKVFVPRTGFIPRGRTSWRNPQFTARHPHPYRRNNVHWGNYQRQPFPSPQVRPNSPHVRPDMRHEIRPPLHHDARPQMYHEMRPHMQHDRPNIHHDLRPNMRPDVHNELMPELRNDLRPELHNDRPEIRHDMRPELRREMRHEVRHEMRPELRHEGPMRPRPQQMGQDISPERPILPQEPMPFRPLENRPPFNPNYPRFPHQFRPEEPHAQSLRPNFEPRPMLPYQRPSFNPRSFPPPPIREIVPNNINHMPQVTIRQALPPRQPLPNTVSKVGEHTTKVEEFGSKVAGREQEVRMLPVQLPTIPPVGLAGKKVLINPHFKGNFQPTDGPVKDIDDAAERFIAEQRNALARAASRKFARRSPQRYIENTTIEIENDLAHGSRRNSDDELLRKQEEFINANRAGLRRRMRSPSPPPVRRSPSPRRSPDRRRPDASRYSPPDEESEYRRRLREQESLRERVIRAKEVRRRKNAVALQKQIQDREREYTDKENPRVAPISNPKPSEPLKERDSDTKPTSTDQDNKPDTTRKSPETVVKLEKIDKPEKIEKLERVERPKTEREKSPVKVKADIAEANSTCENLTPPRPILREKQESLERDLTPPLPDPIKAKVEDKKIERQLDTDDELDLILDDIDDILSEDEDTGRFKDRNKKIETPKPKPPVDLRAKLPPKTVDTKKPRQKIVFEDKESKKKKDKSPPRKAIVNSTAKTEDAENIVKKSVKNKHKDDGSLAKRPRITFDNRQPEKDKDQDKSKQSFSNRRVVLQRKITPTAKETKSVFSRIEIKTDPTKPNPGIFSRAVRTAIGTDKTRIIVKKEPEVEFESDSDIDEDKLLEDEELGNIAIVSNLPHGMTDTRLKTLAGNDAQNLLLDKEERSAKITFKSVTAAESFKKKFNNKMVAASRLTVTLQ